MPLSSPFLSPPAVYAVGDEYEIYVAVDAPCLMRVSVGGRVYTDHAAGVMRSDTPVHHVALPMAILDKARAYTVSLVPMLDRRPYFPETGTPVEETFSFRPVPEDDIAVYHVSDTHGLLEPVIGVVGRAARRPDLLILNGDIPDHCGDEENILRIHQLAGGITQGGYPCVFSRGNHDCRGLLAERLGDYVPTDHGRTYFTVRLGSLWLLVLDCGEDKTDDHAEYGGTVDFHAMRLEETAFLERVVGSAASEYAADGVKTRLVISHIPFTIRDRDETFRIEEELYCRWAELLRENVRPDLMLCGHTHRTAVIRPGEPGDDRGQPCTLIVASAFDHRQEPRYFEGTEIFCRNGEISWAFNDTTGAVTVTK